MDTKTKRILSDIDKQKKIIIKAEERIKILLGRSSGNNHSEVTRPEGFSLMREIMNVFNDDPQKKVAAKEMRRILSEKYKMNLDVRNVRSTLNYLAGAKKNLLVKDRNKVFSLKTQE